MFVLFVLACEITTVGETGVLPIDTGLGDTGTPQTEVSNFDNGPCPAYSGVTALGNSWTYTYDNGSGSYGTLTREIVGFSEPVDGIYEVIEQREEEFSADGLPVTDSSTWYWDCNVDGMWLHYVEGFTSSTYLETTTTQYYDRKYRNGEWLFMARDIGLGSTWTSKVTVVRRGSGTVDNERLTATAEVTEASTVVVPAGTFAALEIAMLSEENTLEWYSSGMGLVRSETLELFEYSP
jgi:hypothetical protein